MSEQRIIIEMGIGNDLHGQDYTKAAARAIEDAFRHSSLPLFPVLGIAHAEMRVKVTVAVQEPDRVDAEALVSKLPRGRVEITVVRGGLNVAALEDDPIVIAQASVEAFLPRQEGWLIRR